MNKVDILQKLFETRSALTRLIIHTSPAPGDADGAQTLTDLIHKREQVTHAIQDVIAADVKATDDDVAKAVGQLADANKQLQDLANTIQNAKTGIAITAQVLNVIAQVVGALM
ncbi:MAG TPA: hypothetical protein VFF06_28295 [Polyangia bacterium]|nr:hypothetical protein [Polyangia bacterium]